MFEISRRDLVIGSAGVAAAFGLSGPLTLVDAAVAQKMPDAGHLKYKIGDIECLSLYDGVWNKKHSDNFIRNATVDQTKAALRASGMSDVSIPIPFTITALKSGGRTILIDTGTGAQLAPTAGKLNGNMMAAGLDPKSVDTILISHFHPDHIFGLMEKGTNAQVYPNAQIFVPRAEYAYWTDPAVIGKLSKRRQGLAKRIQATFPKWKNITQYDDGAELVPGVKAIGAPGHTAGHTVFHVTSGKEQIYVMGDIANIPALFVRNPGWHAVFDADPKLAEANRRKMFEQAVNEKAMIAGYHFGFPNVGTIARDGKGYAFTRIGA